MLNEGKCNVLGVLVDAVDYEYVVRCVLEAAHNRTPLGVSALAVHGLMTGVLDRVHRYRLNHLQFVVPDGQPVRWLMRLLYGARLRDRVYGPKLTGKVFEQAALQGIPVYLYGSTSETVAELKTRIEKRFAGLRVAGYEPSKFRHLSEQEREQLIERVVNSGAHIMFVGLGCPRQEVFAYEFSKRLRMPILAVGAAFDYFSGTLAEPPELLQRLGLQWLFRLIQEPRRLAKRYTVINATFLAYAMLQMCRVWRPNPNDCSRPSCDLLYG
jgi:N-acetylglucosaminyldiphosphoundecaprenol N-acetyl-beta-D-mannosaminyltransferase